MIINVRTLALRGTAAYEVIVRVEVASGNGFSIAGVSASAAKEIVVRVKCALAHVGHPVAGKVTVSFEGAVTDPSMLDFPIAVGILKASGVGHASLDLYVGEMALDGKLLPMRGALVMGHHAMMYNRALVLSVDSGGEAACAGGYVMACESLAEYVTAATNKSDLRVASPGQVSAPVPGVDLAEVRGLHSVRRAMEIAAAGGHPLLLVGPPSAGKSLLARCFPDILPPMTTAESVDATAVWSVAGRHPGWILQARPFRAPHHDVSVAGLVGGGPMNRPGEVSLAHQGVLFLDEIPEFRKDVIAAVRLAIRDGKVVLGRDGSVVYPARAHVIAAMNPCPCGYRGSWARTCSCSVERVRRHVSRVPREMFPLVVEVPMTDYPTLRDGSPDESSAAVRERVVSARTSAAKRLAGTSRTCNQEMHPEQIREVNLDPVAARHLEICVKRFALGGKGALQIVQVARTIADLAGHEQVTATCIAEAVTLSWASAFLEVA